MPKSGHIIQLISLHLSTQSYFCYLYYYNSRTGIVKQSYDYGRLLVYVYGHIFDYSANSCAWNKYRGAWILNQWGDGGTLAQKCTVFYIDHIGQFLLKISKGQVMQKRVIQLTLKIKRCNFNSQVALSGLQKGFCCSNVPPYGAHWNSGRGTFELYNYHDSLHKIQVLYQFNKNRTIMQIAEE